MGLINEIIQSTEVTTETVLFRLLLSFIAGALIGIERESHRQPAGIKTHILICIGSTLLMLLSIYIPQTYKNFQNGDPGRIAAQVVSGIGFIGAGAILRMGINVRGLTTAASIWAIAAVGLAIGAGMYLPALFVVALILIVLIVVEQLEKYFFTPLSLKVISIKTTSSETDNKIRSLLQKYHYRIIEVSPSYNKGESYGYTYKIGSSNKLNWVELSNLLLEIDNQIISLEISDPKIS
jgi:putative Mg2+ transporter-C (MgtC) family protein